MLIKRHSTVLALGTSGQFIESDFHSQNFENSGRVTAKTHCFHGYQTATEKNAYACHEASCLCYFMALRRH